MPAEPSRPATIRPAVPLAFRFVPRYFGWARQKSGRGSAPTLPGLAPKEDLRRETQTNPVRLPCRRVAFSTSEREEDNDGNR
jgi:hypothetical protein